MSSSPSPTEPSSPPLSSLPIENIASRYYLLTGKLYPGVPLLRPPPPPPTSSFNVPQRPSKPQPCKIIPHPLIPGVYVAGDHHDREDDVESLFLYTRNLVPGVQSHDEDVLFSVQDEDGSTMEYREWDPFKSRFAAAILSGAQDISIKPGSRVLVLNSRDDALSGMTISHISDIVGPQGMVYVVEEASRSLLTMASKRFNIVPIVYGEIPHKYRMLINVVDVLFAALDSPKEVRKAFLNAAYFLKTGGKYLVYVQGNCNEPSHQGGDGVFSSLLKGERVQFQRRELVTLERFHRDDHAYVSGVFRSLEVAEIDQSCLVSNKFWTSKDSDRDPGRRITLYEKQKDLPVYMLLESSWGYILFRAVDVYKVERNYMDTEHYIEDFNKFFEFVASHTFASPDEALRYLTADSHDIVPDGLIDFLVRHLPKTMKDGNGNHCYTLALPNPFIAYEIVNAGFACSASPFHVDIMRGVRRNIEKVFEKMKPGDLEKSQACLARIYGKKLDSPNKGKLPKKKAAPLPSFPTRKKPKKKGPEKYMKENPDDTKSLSIVKPMVSWKQLSEAEKAQYAAEAEKRKLEYEEILSAYTKKQAEGPATEGRRKTAKGKKPIDPSIQKVAAGYLLFMEKYRKENPDDTKSRSIVSKPMVSWKQLSEAEKAQYAAKAEKRKLEYEEILSAYTKKQAEGPAAAEGEAYEKSESEVHGWQ